MPGTESKAGVAGEKGATGPSGARGLPGRGGEIELVTCHPGKRKEHCTAKLVTGKPGFASAGPVARAVLSRRGVVDATGAARVINGHITLRLLPRHQLDRGRYTLTLIGGAAKHKRISHESLTLGRPLDGPHRRRGLG